MSKRYVYEKVEDSLTNMWNMFPWYLLFLNVVLKKFCFECKIFFCKIVPFFSMPQLKNSLGFTYYCTYFSDIIPISMLYSNATMIMHHHPNNWYHLVLNKMCYPLRRRKWGMVKNTIQPMSPNEWHSHRSKDIYKIRSHRQTGTDKTQIILLFV